MKKQKPQSVALEPAEQYRLCVGAYNELDVPVQIALSTNLNRLLATAMEATIYKSGEAAARPLGYVANMFRAILQAPTRVVFLRRSECCITFHQTSEIVGPTGQAQVTMEYWGPKAGYGEIARKMAMAALDSVKSLRNVPASLDDDLGNGPS